MKSFGSLVKPTKLFRKTKSIRKPNILKYSGEGTVGRGVFRNCYKGHMDKTKGEGEGGGGREVWLGWGRVVGENADNLTEQQ